MTTDVGNELLAIYEANGRLTPVLVVDTARTQGHPLHPFFEWDDAIAGELHRRDQARHLIRSVTVKRVGGEPSDVEAVRVWHSIRRDDGNEFAPVSRLRDDELLLQQVLQDMRRDVNNLKRRYERFWGYLKDMLNDMDEAA